MSAWGSIPLQCVIQEWSCRGQQQRCYYCTKLSAVCFEAQHYEGTSKEHKTHPMISLAAWEASRWDQTYLHGSCLIKCTKTRKCSVCSCYPATGLCSDLGGQTQTAGCWFRPESQQNTKQLVLDHQIRLACWLKDTSSEERFCSFTSYSETVNGTLMGRHFYSKNLIPVKPMTARRWEKI